MINHRWNPIDITIPLFIVMGITQILLGNYVAAGIWLIIALGQFLVPRVGVANLNQWERPEVLFVWFMVALFTGLVVYQIYTDLL
ncbi:hypothetical protein B6N60_01023 [Richelia sinica FACHB-800]|uniref:Uncharacterized protein n=1 Tax=Richelia sinica FACHB-800 TaxID=1357546 RepID=A0A975T5M0_9NOST|nr:hypothetical protein [Richelia sinica]MBD2664908.1 hypothetical protein [Richelia sinica FACHB-800]QXE22340.1 hypothetical protein B6N60_01023 [Richelia sinica FACHB-800]